VDKLDALLSFHQNALRIRGQRQELLAANIANADTPYYKAKDIDFSKAMQTAVAGQNAVKNGSQLKAATTNPGHINQASGSQSISMATPETLFRPIIQGSVDGNTVDMDVERNQFTDNAIRYEASLTMINGQIKAMLLALQSQ